MALNEKLAEALKLMERACAILDEHMTSPMSFTEPDMRRREMFQRVQAFDHAIEARKWIIRLDAEMINGRTSVLSVPASWAQL